MWSLLTNFLSDNKVKEIWSFIFILTISSGICAVTTTWAAVIIGAVGACVTTFGQIALVKMKIDDPVGASAVHFVGSLWGILSCGLFGLRDNIEHSFSHYDGLLMVHRSS